MTLTAPLVQRVRRFEGETPMPHSWLSRNALRLTAVAVVAAAVVAGTLVYIAVASVLA
jgi:hypothetical protein